MPKILEISVGSQMERSISVRSERNSGKKDLWRRSTSTSQVGPTKICLSILTIGSSPYFSSVDLCYVGNSKKGMKKLMVRLFLLVGPIRSENVAFSLDTVVAHLYLTCHSGIIESTR